jgi:hypothetical protein
MRNNSMTRAALAIATLALGACTGGAGRDAARVDCGTPGPHGVDCQVRRTGGDGAFEACWSLAITCQNGGVMNGSSCHAMAAGAAEGTANMPVAGFSGQDSCDVPASGKVEQLKVTSR